MQSHLIASEEAESSSGTIHAGMGRWQRIAAWLVCSLPLILLFRIRAVFAQDWFNHLWMIEYFGHSMKRHIIPPEVFVTKTAVGMPLALFYGAKFYALSGVLSAYLGSALAFRIVALAVLLIQFWYVERAARLGGPGRWFSFVTATIVTWSIYPLTNLYNRNALPEFVAVAFLNAAISSLFVLVAQIQKGRKSDYDSVASGLLFCGAAITHPLTAIFGGLFLMIVSIAALISLRNNPLFSWLRRVCLTSGIMIAAVLAPWCVVVGLFSGSIPISTAAGAGWCAFPGSIDNFWSRIFPVAFDYRLIEFENRIDISASFFSTQYLDAQITLPLLLIFGLLGWIWFKTNASRVNPLAKNLLCISIALFVFLFGVSLQVTLPKLLAGLFYKLQFPYRLVSYINLAALLAVYCGTCLVDWKKAAENNNVERIRALALTTCVTLSFCALITKLIHASTVMRAPTVEFCVQFNQIMHGVWKIPKSEIPAAGLWTPSVFSSKQDLTDLSWVFTGQGDYIVTEGFAKQIPSGFKQTRSIAFQPELSTHFGSVKPLTVKLDEPETLVTNVQPFPWNKLWVDGVEQKTGDVVVVSAAPSADQIAPLPFQALPLTAGTHLLEYKFRPPLIFRSLEFISWFVLLAWIAILLRLVIGRITKQWKLGQVDRSSAF